jgi:hypothetical protein
MRFGLYAAGTVLWALVLTTVPSPLGYDAFSWAAERTRALNASSSMSSPW